MSANEKAGSQAVGMCGCLKGIFDPETRRKAALQKYQENYRKSMTEQQHPNMKTAQLELNVTGIATPYSSNPALDTIKEESSSHSKARSAHNGSHHERKALAAESRSSLLAST